MQQRKNFFGTVAVVALMCLAGIQPLLHAQGGIVTPSVPSVSFAAPVNYTVGTLPFANAVGDFNGDHILDVAVVNENTNNVSVLFGNGDGTFQPAVNYAVGSSPSAII